MLAFWSVVLALAWASAPVMPARDDRREFVGVAAATQADVVVAWSSRTIWSLDGSKTFLDGAKSVRAVVVAADGTIYAIRGQNQLGVAKPGRGSEWHRTPLDGETRGLEVYGDRLAWIVGSKLALTQDQGRSWTIQDLPPDADHGQLRFLPNGAIDLLAYVENCHSGDYTVRYKGRIDSNRWQRAGVGPDRDFGHPHFGSGDLGRRTHLSRRGWTFILDNTGPGDGERLVRRAERKRPITVLDEHVPEELDELRAVDYLGRVLGLGAGRVWRWSARDRWQAFGGTGQAPPPDDADQ